jgi:glycosyltransferase involved in cell wall biosynthesis
VVDTVIIGYPFFREARHLRLRRQREARASRVGAVAQRRAVARGDRAYITFYLKHFPAAGGPLVGGTSLAVDGLATGLVQSGARVTVLCEGAARSTVTAQAGYTIECFPNHERYRTFTLAPELQRYAAERLAQRRGLCLINGIFHPGAYSMGRLLYRLGVPYVAVPHDPYDRAIFGSNAHLKWPYWYLFERTLLSRARAVQVLDIRHAACLRRLGIDTPCIETPNGVTPDAAPAESQLRWRAPRDPVRVVFLGRMDAYNKGLDLLLKAFARVRGSADISLTVQGPDWGDRARLAQQAAAERIADRVTLREPDYQRSPVSIIGDHDIFCLPSRFEGFGLAALEAMLAARVLLVSEGAGIARHVRASRCGLTIAPTVAGIENGLQALLRLQPAWQEMGMSGRRYAFANLQWKNIGAAALDRYARLLE